MAVIISTMWNKLINDNENSWNTSAGVNIYCKMARHINGGQPIRQSTKVRNQHQCDLSSMHLQGVGSSSARCSPIQFNEFSVHFPYRLFDFYLFHTFATLLNRFTTVNKLQPRFTWLRNWFKDPVALKLVRTLGLWVSVCDACFCVNRS